MKQQVTTGIVLRRTDYGEADRIVNLLTHNQGKVTVYAKGVRRPKSRLAGGIELFSVSDITYIPGKGDMSTLVSSRVLQHFGNIVHDYDATMYAYRLIKAVDQLTENTASEEFFIFLREALASLDAPLLLLDKVQLWASVRLLTLLGNVPNLLTDEQGRPLDPSSRYRFDADNMCFTPHAEGTFDSRHVKLIRVCVGAESGLLLLRVQADDELFPPAKALMQQVASETLQMEL